jgi:hypothetical protein
MALLNSWGRTVKTGHRVIKLGSRHETLPLPRSPEERTLPDGNGRSYGDSYLNAGGCEIKTRTLKVTNPCSTPRNPRYTAWILI